MTYAWDSYGWPEGADTLWPFPDAEPCCSGYYPEPGHYVFLPHSYSNVPDCVRECAICATWAHFCTNDCDYDSVIKELTK